jgi:hypothetical protein
LLDDSNVQHSSSSADSYLFGLCGENRETLSGSETVKKSFGYDEPCKRGSIRDSHSSPGFDCDGGWTEHGPTLRIGDYANESRRRSTCCLAGHGVGGLRTARPKEKESEHREHDKRA